MMAGQHRTPASTGGPGESGRDRREGPGRLASAIPIPRRLTARTMRLLYLVVRRPQYRNPLAALLVGLVAGSLLTARTTHASPFRRGDARVDRSTELVLIGGNDPSGTRQRLIDAWNSMADEWNRDPAHDAHRKPRARAVWLPSASGEQLAEMVRRAQTPARDADVFVLDAPWTRQFAAQGYIRRLDVDVDTSAFLTEPLRTCRVNESLYALPFNTDAGLLLSWGLPVPNDWSDLTTTARTTSPGTAAFAGQFGPGEGFVVNVLEGVLARGGQIMDSRGQLDLHGRDVAKALHDLSKDLRTAAVMAGRSDLDEVSSRDAFVNREVAYLRNWPAFAPRTPDGHLLPEITTSRLPWPSVLGGQNLAVAQESRYPRASGELIEWLTSEVSQLRLLEEGGYAATRQSVYYDTRIRERYPYSITLLDAIKNSVRRPDVPNYPLFSQVFARVMRRVLDTDGVLTDADFDEISAAVQGKVVTEEPLDSRG